MSRGSEVVPFSICFVCAGNICRSPMAEIVFQTRVAQAGLSPWVTATSAGIGDWHVGERADQRTLDALSARGYDGARHRAKQFDSAWFPNLDLVVALDRSHLRALTHSAPTASDRDKVALLMSFDDAAEGIWEVPDPYYSDAETFDQVLGMIERASLALFRQLEPAIRQGALR
ncbi:low molecular weight protein-tyrosine-phosphatase [Microbacterium sp. MPKO10]|uniref:low molecular weight protein-tyrosine-phosphatase n=1 Tax=Microbacterium sp. MPKO10 TaxID=2989818 RepID=UPI00223622B7|nr:low molecular weight protein-tyrosine-phosphatase [Microbacterium sp. MPKO10]MCW4459113.1 low molecular weight phosphotyrosine protein phosphatase [Microbacterium sp. MPKO10]